MIKKIIALTLSILIFENYVLAVNPYRVVAAWDDLTSDAFKSQGFECLSSRAVKNLAFIEESDFNSMKIYENK